MNGRHRTKSKVPFAIKFGTGVAVIWVFILAFFLYQSPAHVPVAPAQYVPSSGPSPSQPLVFPAPQAPVAPVAKVTPGQTLWLLARKYCGNGIYWKHLAAENRIGYPWVLPIGKMISVDCRLPERMPLLPDPQAPQVSHPVTGRPGQAGLQEPDTVHRQETGEGNMSYAKFGWDKSDVYLIGSMTRPPPDGIHVIECCMCMLDPEPGPLGDLFDRASYGFATKEALFAHLEEHRKAGHTVPQSTVDQIAEDDWIQ